MSIFGTDYSGIQWDKHCFVYCGDDKCDCGSASQTERNKHEAEEKLKRLLEAAKEKQRLLEKE
jgi:hypothetical protein